MIERKRNAHFEVRKSHFICFKKQNSRREFFNQIKSLLRNQLNFKSILGTNAQLSELYGLNRTAICEWSMYLLVAEE